MRAQRLAIVRVAGAYRTASTIALQLMAAAIPIHLLVEERRLFEIGMGHFEETGKESRRVMLKMAK